MFLGLALIFVFIFLNRTLREILDYDARWIVEGGFLIAFSAGLSFLGAWKWLNLTEDDDADD